MSTSSSASIVITSSYVAPVGFCRGGILFLFPPEKALDVHQDVVAAGANTTVSKAHPIAALIGFYHRPEFNSLIAMDCHDRPIFNKLLWRLVTSTIYVHC